MPAPISGGSIRAAKLREMDAKLIKEGWPEISPWWWNVLQNADGVRNIVVRGGRRGGKSSTVCRVAVAEVLDDRHVVPPGDVAFFAIVSATKEQAQERLKTCGEILKALGVANKQTADKILLIDKNVGIRVFAATLKGVVSFTALGALCDEEARWADPDTGANPAEEVLSSLKPTMATMKHAQMWHVSSPWSTLDVHHKMVVKGNTKAQRVFCGASWELNPTLTEEETHLLEPDYQSWLREYAAVPMVSDETKFFSAQFVDMALVESSSMILQRELNRMTARTVAGGDFAFRSDASAVVALTQIGEGFFLAMADERIPGENSLIPSETIKQLAVAATIAGADCLATDLHYIETVREVLDDLGDIALMEFPTQNSEIAKAYVRTRVLLSQGRLSLVGAPQKMIDQLKETTAKPTAEGLNIMHKRRAGSHGDYVSALVCAVWCADQSTIAEQAAVGPRRYSRGEGTKTGELTMYPTEEDLN